MKLELKLDLEQELELESDKRLSLVAEDELRHESRL